MALTVERNFEGPPRIRELDGWRAISALLVIVVHIGTTQHPRLFSRVPGALPTLVYWGPLAVKIFFVISGFVICRLLISEELTHGWISLRAFYYRRACRILPPLYTYLAVLSLLLSVGLIRDSWRGIVATAFFLTDVRHIPIPHSWFIAHTWSLAIEEQFYLIFPPLFVLASRRYRRKVCLGVFLLTVIWNLSTAFRNWDWITSPQTREGFACISCGVLMAVYETRAREVVRAIPWYVSTSLTIILFIPPFWVMGAGSSLYQSMFVPLAIGLMLLTSVVNRSPLSRFLNWKPVQAIGAVSYGIYLWQQLFTASKVSVSETGTFLNFSAAGEIIPMCLILLGVIVPLSFVFIEKPAMRLGKELSLRAAKRELVEVSS
jgi:peptidoglycan/LPS O-acetylase OafA/YrhL